MGVLERARYVVNADLELLLKKGRDPQLVLEGYLENLEEVLEETRQIRRAEEADLDFLLAQQRDIHAAMKDLEKKALRCLEMGDEGLARAAIARKLELDGQLEETEEQVQERRRNLEILDNTVKVLEARLKQVHKIRRRLRLRRQLLEARSSLQKAAAKVRGHDEHFLGEASERLAEMEGVLEAEELVDAQDTENRFLREEIAISRRQAEERLEKELERLRKQIKGSGVKRRK